MSLTVKEVVDSVDELVSLPEAYVKINKLLDDPETRAADLGNVISQDPALTARMLRIANSAFYGMSKEIDNVSKAVRVIGMQKIHDLVLATSVTKAFDGLPNDLVTMKDFWTHSIYCALIAKALAVSCKHESGETLFAAGMLHDIGQLIIFNKLPEQAHKVLMNAIENPTEPEIYALEREFMGFDHCQVGGELARKWKLPKLLQACIEYHHEPDQAQDFSREVAIVHIANRLAINAEVNSTELDDMPKIPSYALETAGVSPENFASIIAEARSQFKEMLSTLLSD